MIFRSEFGWRIRTTPTIEERFVAFHTKREIINEQGIVIGEEVLWRTLGTPSHLSVRIHGEAVPEPGIASLLIPIATFMGSAGRQEV